MQYYVSLFIAHDTLQLDPGTRQGNQVREKARIRANASSSSDLLPKCCFCFSFFVLFIYCKVLRIERVGSCGRYSSFEI